MLYYSVSVRQWQSFSGHSYGDVDDFSRPDCWSPLIMRRLQEKFNLSLLHLHCLQAVLAAESANMDFSRPLTDLDLSKGPLALSLEPEFLTELRGQVLIQPPKQSENGSGSCDALMHCQSRTYPVPPGRSEIWGQITNRNNFELVEYAERPIVNALQHIPEADAGNYDARRREALDSAHGSADQPENRSPSPNPLDAVIGSYLGDDPPATSSGNDLRLASSSYDSVVNQYRFGADFSKPTAGVVYTEGEVENRVSERSAKRVSCIGGAGEVGYNFDSNRTSSDPPPAANDDSISMWFADSSGNRQLGVQQEDRPLSRSSPTSSVNLQSAIDAIIANFNSSSRPDESLTGPDFALKFGSHSDYDKLYCSAQGGINNDLLSVATGDERTDNALPVLSASPTSAYPSFQLQCFLDAHFRGSDVRLNRDFMSSSSKLMGGASWDYEIMTTGTGEPGKAGGADDKIRVSVSLNPTSKDDGPEISFESDPADNLLFAFMLALRQASRHSIYLFDAVVSCGLNLAAKFLNCQPPAHGILLTALCDRVLKDELDPKLMELATRQLCDANVVHLPSLVLSLLFPGLCMQDLEAFLLGTKFRDNKWRIEREASVKKLEAEEEEAVAANISCAAGRATVNPWSDSDRKGRLVFAVSDAPSSVKAVVWDLIAELSASF